MMSHVYFVDGMLIDTGHTRMRRTIVRILSQLPVKHIFLTHYHEDHSGNLHPLVKHFQCPVYASARTAEIMKAPPAISPAQAISWGNRPAFEDIIPIENEIQTLNHTFQIIPIPGHAPDMVALYEPNKKWLFSADLYVHHYIRYFLSDESMLQQIQSINRILHLDFDVLLCSHAPQFKGGKQLLQKKLHFFEQFFSDVQGLYQQGYSAEEIGRQMRLKENKILTILSRGSLTPMNMVRSVIRDLQSGFMP